MSQAGSNLTGAWDGIYFYKDFPEAGPDTPFLATIIETNGTLTGTVIEPHEFTQETIMATIIGHRSGALVTFAKDYEGDDEDYQETVQYRGTLSPDCEMIVGEWNIGHWSGPFEMTRAPRLEEQVGEKTGAQVPVVAGLWG